MTAQVNKIKRAAIAAKIKRLMNMTVERGATEAEALNAAEAVARLMNEHDMAYSDIDVELRAEEYVSIGRPYYLGKQKRMIFYALASIGTFWGCKTFTKDNIVVFFGEREASENAHLMSIMLTQTIDREANLAKAGIELLRRTGRVGKTAHGKTLRTSFMYGMTLRIAQRLLQIVNDRKAQKDQPGSSSTALVIQTKEKIIEDKFDVIRKELNIKKITPNQSSETSLHFKKVWWQGIVCLLVSTKKLEGNDNDNYF